MCPNYGLLGPPLMPRPYRTTVIVDEPTSTATPTLHIDDDDYDDDDYDDGDYDDDATPTKMSSLEYHQILETRAVDGTEPSHTLSPRDNEEELRVPMGVSPSGLCQHKEQDCTRWHGILLPTEAAVMSKRDTDHHFSHRAHAAEPTVTQTSTTTHFPTPTTAIKGCPENDRQCQGSFFGPPQLEEAKNKNPKMMCAMGDWECQNGIEPPVKEEKRDVDVVLPTATGTSELKPDVNCLGAPWLCS